MSKTLSLVPLALQPGRSLDIRDGKGTAISARSGVIWITQTGDKRDIVLQAGETFTVDRDGLTLVGAVGAPAAITLLPAQEHAFGVIAARETTIAAIDAARSSPSRYY